MSGRRGRRTYSTAIVEFPAAPERLVTRTGPLGGPYEELTWLRGTDGRYRAPGKRAATFDALAARYDQVRCDL